MLYPNLINMFLKARKINFRQTKSPEGYQILAFHSSQISAKLLDFNFPATSMHSIPYKTPLHITIIMDLMLLWTKSTKLFDAKSFHLILPWLLHYAHPCNFCNGCIFANYLIEKGKKELRSLESIRWKTRRRFKTQVDAFSVK